MGLVKLWRWGDDGRPMECVFCQRPTDKQWAITVERLTGERERLISPLCARCNFYLGRSGDKGVRVKTTGERWYPGHVHGGVFNYEAPWIKDPRWRG